MFDEAIGQRLATLKAEHAQALYRYYTLTRERDQVVEGLIRMEAGLFELQKAQSDWRAEKMIGDAKAAADEPKAKKQKKKQKKKAKKK